MTSHSSSFAPVTVFFITSMTDWVIWVEFRELCVLGCSGQEWILYLPGQGVEEQKIILVQLPKSFLPSFHWFSWLDDFSFAS